MVSLSGSLRVFSIDEQYQHYAKSCKVFGLPRWNVPWLWHVPGVVTRSQGLESRSQEIVGVSTNGRVG
jgi:hypothetical protein